MEEDEEDHFPSGSVRVGRSVAPQSNDHYFRSLRNADHYFRSLRDGNDHYFRSLRDTNGNNHYFRTLRGDHRGATGNNHYFRTLRGGGGTDHYFRTLKKRNSGQNAMPARRRYGANHYFRSLRRQQDNNHYFRSLRSDPELGKRLGATNAISQIVAPDLTAEAAGVKFDNDALRRAICSDLMAELERKRASEQGQE